MSRFTYAGEFKNPTSNWSIRSGDNCWQIWVRSDRARDGSAEPDHKHTSAPDFETYEDAEEWINGCSEAIEQDYDDYLDENRYEISRMEQYEQWRNEK